MAAILYTFVEGQFGHFVSRAQVCGEGRFIAFKHIELHHVDMRKVAQMSLGCLIKGLKYTAHPEITMSPCVRDVSVGIKFLGRRDTVIGFDPVADKTDDLASDLGDEDHSMLLSIKFDQVIEVYFRYLFAGKAEFGNLSFGLLKVDASGDDSFAVRRIVRKYMDLLIHGVKEEPPAIGWRFCQIRSNSGRSAVSLDVIQGQLHIFRPLVRASRLRS
jgi:hypothetical protein